MADKKKKKTKMKQKQQQTQNVIINVGRQRSSKPKQQAPPQQPQPQQQTPVIYRDNNSALVNSFLSDKTRENAITKLLLEHSQAEERRKRPELAKPSVALIQQQPQPPNVPPPPNVLRAIPPDTNKVVRDLIINNNIHHSVKLPTEPTGASKKAEAFEAVINNKKIEEPPAQPAQQPVQQAKGPQPELPVLDGVRMNRRGMPDRRTRQGKAMYEEMMRAQNAEQPPPMASASVQPPLPPPPPLTSSSSYQATARVMPSDNNDEYEDEEGLTFFSPVKRKPT